MPTTGFLDSMDSEHVLGQHAVNLDNSGDASRPAGMMAGCVCRLIPARGRRRAGAYSSDSWPA